MSLKHIVRFVQGLTSITQTNPTLSLWNSGDKTIRTRTSKSVNHNTRGAIRTFWDSFAARAFPRCPRCTYAESGYGQIPARLGHVEGLDGKVRDTCYNKNIAPYFFEAPPWERYIQHPEYSRDQTEREWNTMHNNTGA